MVCLKAELFHSKETIRPSLLDPLGQLLYVDINFKADTEAGTRS